MGRYAITVVMTLTFALIAYNHGMVSTTLQAKGETISEFNRSQARILAMSIAEIAIQSLSDEDDDTFLPDTDDTLRIPSSGFEEWEDLSGEYAVTAVNSGDSLLTLLVEARFNESDYSVNVGLEFNSGGDEWNPDLSKAVFAGETITLQGSARIRGHVATNSTAVNGVRMQWSTKIDSSLTIGPGGNPATVANLANPAGNLGPQGIKIGTSIKTHPMPVYPEYPDKTSPIANWNITAWPVVAPKMPADYNGKYIPTLSISGNAVLTLNTGTEDRVLHVGTLNISQGHLDILGTGRLTIYVENSFTLNGSSTVNRLRTSNTVIMYYGGASVTVAGATSFKGDLFANTANISLTGSGGFQGHIITGGTTVNVTGAADAHSRVIYAPNATVSMTGSGKVTGTVVARHYLGSGSADVYFATGLEENVPPLKMAGGGGGGGGSGRVSVKAFY
jgi:hypothetical protein